MKKLNTLLAVTNTAQSAFKAMTKDYASFFKGKQGAFVGEKATYEPEPNTVDDESKRKNVAVQTTVGEKLEWYKENAQSFLNDLFTVERANANNVTAELVVGEKSFGHLTTLELLRLKGLLEDNNIMTMIQSIPVRSDSDNWEEATVEQYAGREGIFQSTLQTGEVKTTVKTTYVLEDPNIGKLKDATQYTPQLGQKNDVHVLGQYTHQRFSGEWSQRQRAELLKRRNDLYVAVVAALKEANEVEVVEQSKLGSDVLDYLF